MHTLIKNLTLIQKEVYQNNPNTKIIAVSKTFSIDKILPLINFGHIHYGENKVQEAKEKWSLIKKENKKIKLHLIGKLQKNKVKFAVDIFDYIHSLDSFKLAQKIADEQIKKSKKLKIFIQVNLGDEQNKAGISLNNLEDLLRFSLKINLNVIGLMCIPPLNKNPSHYFEQLKFLNTKLGLNDLSMGMSSDYMMAIKNNATYVRIGSSIFGKRN